RRDLSLERRHLLLQHRDLTLGRHGHLCLAPFALAARVRPAYLRPAQAQHLTGRRKGSPDARGSGKRSECDGFQPCGCDRGNRSDEFPVHFSGSPLIAATNWPIESVVSTANPRLIGSSAESPCLIEHGSVACPITFVRVRSDSAARVFTKTLGRAP